MNNTETTPFITEASLLKRVQVFLEDGEFDRADEYCERVLDMNVENGEAYLYKLLASLRLTKKQELSDLNEPFDSEASYAKIMRYGNAQLKKEIADINASIIARLEEAEKKAMLEKGLQLAEDDSVASLAEAYRIFTRADNTEKAEECKAKIEQLYDENYNRLFMLAKEKEQAINDLKYQNSTDLAEREYYDRYIKENHGKKVFDYSLLVAICVCITCIIIAGINVRNFFLITELSFKAAALCFFTRILPAFPITWVSTVLSFIISKKIVKKQKKNLLEDIGTAADRAREIAGKVGRAESETLVLQKELDEVLEALRKLNAEYDVFLAEKEKENISQA